jgi:hypothetical protein
LILALILLISLAQEAHSEAPPDFSDLEDTGQPTTSDGKPLDIIKVGGLTMPGRVVRLHPTGIEMETTFGEGTVKIFYAKIEFLYTHHTFKVLYGRDSLSEGRILGLEGGVLIVGEDRETAVRIPVEEITGGVSLEQYEKSRLTRLRTDWRHWSANLDLGFNFETGAINKDKIRFGFGVERALVPTRILLDLDYAFETQQAEGEEELKTKDELHGSVRYFHDITRRISAFGAFSGEFDIPRQIKLRIYPAVGLAFDWVRSEKGFFQPMIGIAYVYEEFTGDLIRNNDYPALLLGFGGEVALPFGSSLGGTVIYLPGLEDPDDNWLFRSDFWLTIPVWDPLALKFVVRDVYDNNPAPNVGNNKFITTMGMTLEF